MKSRAVGPDGTPTGAKDERGILLDLSLHDVEAMSQREPGSAARYLEERRKQEAEFKEKQRQEDTQTRFEEAFVAAGGEKKDATAACRAHKNEQAATAARAADEAAVYQSRRRIRGIV